MKKTYISPSMECYEVRTGCTLLEGSLTSLDVMFDDYNQDNMIDLAPLLDNPDIPDFVWSN